MKCVVHDNAASVIGIVGTLPVCRLLQERNRVYARRNTQYGQPDCERWVTFVCEQGVVAIFVDVVLEQQAASEVS